MKVTIYVINEGQSGQYYGLKSVEGFILPYAPTWKTKKGAINYANKKGYELV